MTNVQSRARKPRFNSVCFPLDEFYAGAGLPLPKFARIDGRKMLEPYRGLLVHNGDMTPALESHYGRRVHLRVLRAHRSGAWYAREVVLLLDGLDRPVEFGAIRINLGLFGKAAQKDIIKGARPLGAIMRARRVKHSSRPSAFFKVQSDGLIAQTLNLDAPATLYGRRNTLLTPEGQPLAEITEILAPAL